MSPRSGPAGASQSIPREARQALFKPRDAWEAIKGVWCSLFAIRPWVSLAKAGRSFHDLNMAVLVQELVEAKYAFVLHTVNPFTHDKDELYGELVAGRGETWDGVAPSPGGSSGHQAARITRVASPLPDMCRRPGHGDSCHSTNRWAVVPWIWLWSQLAGRFD